MHSVPYGLKVTVEIRREGGCAYVEVHSPLYVTKQWEMPHCYSDSFTDSEILMDSDFCRVLSRAYPKD